MNQPNFHPQNHHFSNTRINLHQKLQKKVQNKPKKIHLILIAKGKTPHKYASKFSEEQKTHHNPRIRRITVEALSITVDISAPVREEPVGDDHEERGSHRNLDLPPRGDQNIQRRLDHDHVEPEN